MSQVTGSVDDRGRPVIRIEGKVDSILAIVDTGFNGDLIVTSEAAFNLDMIGSTREATVELGDGTIANVLQGHATISWLGTTRRIRVLVSETWKTKPDAPTGMVGTELLTPHILTINFTSRKVEIR